MKFKNKNLNTAAGVVMKFLGISKIPTEDGKVKFSEDQEEKLKEELSEETLQKTVDAFNREIENDPKIKGINKQITELLQEIDDEETTGATQAKNKVPGDDDDEEASDETEKLQANIDKLEAALKQRDDAIAALLDDANKDTPLALINSGKHKELMKHSETHLFSSGKDFDAFEGRNWNKFAAGLVTEGTDWTAGQGANIDKLNGDIEHFYRENPDQIDSLHRDNFGLPAHWKKRYGVVDRVTSASIVTASITQARKLNWLPKNKQAIKSEEGYIYPISIDIEYVGHYLSEIEASWMASYNKEGSQAYKMTFVMFLVSEISKRARLEDRIATIGGVYVPTPDNATKPGNFINRQNGLLYWYWKARDIDKKYRAFSIGLPTSENIVDYVDSMIKRLPLDVRNQVGLEYQLSPAWLKAYKRRYEVIHSQNTDYSGVPAYPKDYANIKFVEVVDYEGSDFMAITFSNNIEILENLPKEKSMYSFEYLKRMIYIFADYKLGIRLMHIGNKVKSGDPDEFKVQTVWSNTAPIFKSDFFAPAFDDTTGELELTFNQIKVDDAWATDITKVSGLAPGIQVKIQGNTSLAATKNVLNGDDISLAGGSAFDLKTGGTLTLIVMADGKLKELTRTTEPEVVTTDGVAFEDSVLDADLGSDFTLTGTTAVAITEVVNGVPSQVIKITGNGEANVTLSTTGNIEVTAAATLATDTDYIELTLVDDKWIEFNREISA